MEGRTRADYLTADYGRVVPLYRAYGILIDCDVLLPELALSPPGQHAVGAAIRARLNIIRPVEFDAAEAFMRLYNAKGDEWFLSGRCTGGYLLRFVGVADFFVSERGDRIECCSTGAKILPETLRHLLLDAVIPEVLDLIGKESMHATAVLTDYGACAFIGPSGAGKSTLAASFALAGVPLLGDDCIVLSGGDRLLLTPGYPGTRLWGDSVEALRIDPARSHAIAGYSSKRRAFDFHFSSLLSQPQPLARIFRLNRCNDADSPADLPRIEQLSSAEAFMELISASYRFDPTDRAANLRQFHFLEQVVARVPVKKLVVPNDFIALPAVREMVLADLSSREGDSVGFFEAR